ncbi:MAG: COG4280 domain-containing protein [Acidimicrobiia bacterium]
MSGAVLVLAAFLACAVEMVEATTIVLAVGVTRGWRSPLLGAGAATLTLTVVIGALGPALVRLPIDALRIVVGGLLLTFGLQWLRKAILRGGGYKALHDEDAIFREEIALLEREGGARVRAGMDWYAFTLAFKGVFLEGLEVAFIVLTFGTNEGHIGLAAIGAGAAVIVVAVVAVIVHAPLSRVPENTLKFSVGLMLTSFGAFWSTEGVGVRWPGNDVAIVGLFGLFLAVSLGTVKVLQTRGRRLATA